MRIENPKEEDQRQNVPGTRRTRRTDTRLDEAGRQAGRVQSVSSGLPVDSPHDLTQSPARIERVARIAVRVIDLEDRGAAARSRLIVEVDVVEHVQHVDAELEIDPASGLEALGQADVEPREPRRPDEERPRRAIAVPPDVLEKYSI